ncbi:hypothetical protein PYW08_010412 [Mythimna loreyi]|uniref:Uncharacterized protein n=1 Tax=Mythimna loreyi TaxID=667449 RepID=A0ACC2Q4Q4_9NEOP|nr:hypothetical protein PYW08_010412 [Mythimna loreyi]
MYKMPRKIAFIALPLVITFSGWIYWKCYAELNEALISLKRKLNTTKEVSLEPFPITSHTFLVIIVTSYVGNLEIRNAHRRTIPIEKLRDINATRVFLLAQIPYKENYITQSAINNESKTYGDILQGTFLENYRNVPRKLLMGLKWASTTCRNASFILKVDDDTVYSLEKTYEYLNLVNYRKDFISGYITNNTPERDRDDKWYVTWYEYPRQEYPPYLSGYYYITTPHVAAALCEEAVKLPYFWIEDIFVTGILTESLGIELTQLPCADCLQIYIDCDYVGGQKEFHCRL